MLSEPLPAHCVVQKLWHQFRDRVLPLSAVASSAKPFRHPPTLSPRNTQQQPYGAPLGSPMGFP